MNSEDNNIIYTFNPNKETTHQLQPDKNTDWTYDPSVTSIWYNGI